MMAKKAICKAIVNSDNEISFESAIVSGTSIEEIILEDKTYGILKPRNGKYFTFGTFDWKNRWIQSKQITKGIGIAWNMVEKVISIDVREATKDETPDFPIYFRKTADDPLLTSDTLMYQHYPISDLDSEFRGVCVVNSDFTWTIDGKGIPLHIFDPEHYPEPMPNTTARTYDFDSTYQHEGPGHGLGLPHSPNKNKKMSASYPIMAESIFDEDDDETIIRLQAKYPKREMILRHLIRWIKYYLIRRDKY